jgi:CSLREA domain-containing protein
MWPSTAFLLLFAASSAAAVDIVVTRLDDPLPDGCGVADCSLREAVLFANGSVGPDRILLPASASPYQLTRSGAGEDAGLTGDLDVIGALEIAGQGDAPVVIAQAAIDRILHLQGVGAPTTLRNVHLQGGRGVTQGGAVLAASADLQVVGATFTNNVATGSGGAIGGRCRDDVFGAVLVRVDASAFEGNSAPQGGAIALLPSVTSNCNIEVEDSDFIDNDATTLGGAIAVDASLSSSRLDIRGGLFSGNRVTGASVAGGAVAMGTGGNNARIEDAVFLDNHADGTTNGRGGAAFNVSAIARSSFLANTADRGGAVYTIVLDMEDSQLCDNEAALDGGALFVSSRIALRRSTFCRNSAAGSGGAMKLTLFAGADATIERSTFDGNTAPTGGAISMDDGELRMFQSTLASVDVPAQGSVGTALRYSGPDDAANGSRVELTGNLLRGTCSFAAGVGAVNLAKHNVNSGGNTCGLTQAGAAFANNATFTPLAAIPLAPLANNGGPTVTRLPSPAAGHPAAGRVPLADCVDPDQRGYVTTNATCDAGAVELDGVVPPDAIFAGGFEG